MAVPEYISPNQEDDEIQCNHCIGSILFCALYLFCFAVFAVVSFAIPSFEYDWQRDLTSWVATLFFFASLGLPIPAIGFGIHSLYYNIKNYGLFENKTKAVSISAVCGVLIFAVVCVLLWYIHAWFTM